MDTIRTQNVFNSFPASNRSEILQVERKNVEVIKKLQEQDVFELNHELNVFKEKHGSIIDVFA